MDEYVVEDIISKEAAVIVCRVLHKSTSRRFAMKIFDTAVMGLHRHASLRVELNTLLPNKHPNVVNVHDVNVEDGLCYVVCDLEEGNDLFDVLVKKGRFSETEAKALMKVLLETVGACHALGMVHRNLKPESVRMPSEDPASLMLSNFSLCSSIDAEMTTVCGSPDYMAPEVLANLHGKHLYGKEVDVWSLGVMAYVLLSGTFPFAGSTQVDLFKAIQTGKVDVSSGTWTSISLDAKNFVSEMLIVDPTQRATIDLLLLHPWINPLQDLASASTESKGVHALRKFKAAAMTVQAAVALKTHFCAPRTSPPSISVSEKKTVEVTRKEQLTIDTFLLDYDIHKEVLSEGKFSITRRGTFKPSGKDVEMTFYSKALMEFDDEIELNTMIDVLRHMGHHDHIVHVHDFYTDSDEYCLVMDAVDGTKDLFDHVVDKGCSDEREARHMMTCLLKAVAHCHRLGIVHRNIKLESIMIADTLNAVKLSNFGMAARIDTDLTVVCGSHDYIAPEILENIDGPCPYGIQVDIWSLGVLLFVLLGGYLPFHGNSQDDLYRAIKIGRFEFDEPYWEGISSAAQDIISKMLVTDPQKRSSAFDLLLHPWILDVTSPPVGDAVSRSSAIRKFKTAALSVKAAVSFKMSTTFASKYTALNTTTCVCNESGELYRMARHAKAKLSRERVRCFLAHAAKVKTLKHPHVVRIHDIFNDSDAVYVVEDRVTGGELFDRIVQKDGYNEVEAVQLITDLLHVVDYCHRMGVPHSNLKAENIWLESPQDDSPIKLANFGQTYQELTASIDYAAPEVISLLCGVNDGEKRFYNKPADVWSIGVIAYVLLCGYLPFQGHNRFALFKNIKRGKFEFESPYWDYISKPAKAFISQALAVNANTRPTVTDLLQHAWITDIHEGPCVSLTSTVDNLTAFNARKKLKAVMALVKASLTLQKSEERVVSDIVAA
ncbi:CAMK protein kinase [Aphanomyces invadans]|uniref:CAMK protein kinase n=1 Tax=Aphanomyces invadans TaxID=157072 RepID=A0A024U3V7_9STRA|nr:CAMK protein kinase [Aphanomyces invadans]ETW00899.1 CAMK protein kinase [Aphanomyces invadans]|eukprot:XP_008869897.1 CAMK protein kinase [Aphanomyces invadans]